MSLGSTRMARRWDAHLLLDCNDGNLQRYVTTPRITTPSCPQLKPTTASAASGPPTSIRPGQHCSFSSVFDTSGAQVAVTPPPPSPHLSGRYRGQAEPFCLRCGWLSHPLHQHVLDLYAVHCPTKASPTTTPTPTPTPTALKPRQLRCDQQPEL